MPAGVGNGTKRRPRKPYGEQRTALRGFFGFPDESARRLEKTRFGENALFSTMTLLSTTMSSRTVVRGSPSMEHCDRKITLNLMAAYTQLSLEG